MERVGVLPPPVGGSQREGDSMLNSLIIGYETEPVRNLSSKLAEQGLSCAIHLETEAVTLIPPKPAPDLVLVSVNGSEPGSGSWMLPSEVKRLTNLPILALLTKDHLENLDLLTEIDDFVLEPWQPEEIAARARRMVLKTRGIDGEEHIRNGDLLIDLAGCEVFLRGRRLDLTFREYELLKFLATSRGRVFTRDVLLDRVWGYDYFGGDRTVDVHVRRLRSKLEDTNQEFIETVRNIGYRFRSADREGGGPR